MGGFFSFFYGAIYLPYERGRKNFTTKHTDKEKKKPDRERSGFLIYREGRGTVNFLTALPKTGVRYRCISGYGLGPVCTIISYSPPYSLFGLSVLSTKLAVTETSNESPSGPESKP